MNVLKNRPGTRVKVGKGTTKKEKKEKKSSPKTETETKEDEKSDLSVADLKPDEEFEIIQELRIEFLQNRSKMDLNSLKVLDAVIKPIDDKLEKFTHIYIEVEAERDDTSDWKKLDIIYKDQYLPYYGLKIENQNLNLLFPIRVQVDLNTIPKFLRNKIFLIPRAYTCRVK
ncbi:MAG: hypothetical protein P8Y97_03295 [Candidatus Lokiarchaeota archaeon]